MIATAGFDDVVFHAGGNQRFEQNTHGLVIIKGGENRASWIALA